MRRRWATIATIAIGIAIAILIAQWQRSRTSSRAAGTSSAAAAGDRPAPASRRPPPGVPGTTSTPPSGGDVPEFAVDHQPRPRGNDPTWHPPEQSEVEDDALMARAEWLLDADKAPLARDAAYQILARRPDEPRMFRVVVLAGCTIGGDGVKEAHQYYPRVAGEDREVVAAQCRSHGVELAASHGVDR